jgi:hypothetical protein
MVFMVSCKTVEESNDITSVEVNEEMNETTEVETLNINQQEETIDSIFSDRDLEQTYDETNATLLELENDTEVVIVDEGIYVIRGEVQNTTILVEAGEEAKIQLVLDGISITNENDPAIYVKSADKVFVTTTDSKNYLGVIGEYTDIDKQNLDAVIFSKADLVINGIGTLEIDAMTGNGISSKDDLKITGGVLFVKSLFDGLEANDTIAIYEGTITIDSQKDALHSENEEDSLLGSIYIQGGVFTLTAVDDAIRGTSYVIIDDGKITIESCEEGIEATYIQINGGEISIQANDDGINATEKSDAYETSIEINGGSIQIIMASGDTDGMDSNGDIIINGGIISVDAVSAFDADGTAEFNSGEIYMNGEQIYEIVQTQMGGRDKK